jgi:dTDP-4-amino-4,6-dideoxygalactose transaminase
MKILFNKPYHFKNEIKYATEALQTGQLSGNRNFGKKCIQFLKDTYGVLDAFLTPSCTAALEMGIILGGVEAGDEVILPSFTFSSTANAVVLRGAKPVFCDVDPKTMNMDTNLIEGLITEKTKMILPIDYMGIPCDIDEINRIAEKHDLIVMVDSAQSQHSKYKGKFTGSQTTLATFSFHETKNFSCGEGGALLVNDESLLRRAHFLQEKGTDRSLVLAGVKSKYSWVDEGSSYLLSDVLAGVLLSQLENVDFIVSSRKKVVDAYFKLYQPYADAGLLEIPVIPDYVELNNHAFFVIFKTEEERTVYLAKLREYDVYSYIGYVPLHSSPMGAKLGYEPEDVPLTYSIGSRIARLPCYTALGEEGLDYCIDSMHKVLKEMFN